MDAQSAHVINSAVNLFDDMRYYNVISGILGRDDITSTQATSRRLDRPFIRWSPPTEGWIKINMDISRRECTYMESIGYIMRDSLSNVIMAKSKSLGDCPTLNVLTAI